MKRILLMSVFAIVATANAAPASGPLRVSKANPRYFADAQGKVVYLTGSHTWNNLVDMAREEPPGGFDYENYLNFLDRHGHNFVRLWAWDSTVWDTRANGSLGKDFVHHAAPLPWARTGPGNALDGKPKFDLNKFDDSYFKRLRDRVRAAGDRGIYVSVMLFEGWGLMHGNSGRAAPAGWAWRSHPYNRSNNVNQVDGGVPGNDTRGRVHSMADPRVNEIQKAYIHKVVDTVNELDNVLYEVINEGGEKEWDWWVVAVIRDYQKSKPNQHPIGITGHGAERLASMLASPADWISPGRSDGYAEDPPAWDGKKVSILDTDHIWGVGGNASWVWKSFLRGHNPIFMDPYDGSVLGKPGDTRWEPIQRAMGYTRNVARGLNLKDMVPQPDLASTRYCLANIGREYLAYQPKASEPFTINLAEGVYTYEWHAAGSGKSARTGEITAPGGDQQFKAPFDDGALLHLKRQ